jgi:hypothetical protein
MQCSLQFFSARHSKSMYIFIAFYYTAKQYKKTEPLNRTKQKDLICGRFGLKWKVQVTVHGLTMYYAQIYCATLSINMF